jgi:hypothetical protein
MGQSLIKSKQELLVSILITSTFTVPLGALKMMEELLMDLEDLQRELSLMESEKEEEVSARSLYGLQAMEAENKTIVIVTDTQTLFILCRSVLQLRMGLNPGI